jgi:ABC1 atypical kinase-like domain
MPRLLQVVGAILSIANARIIDKYTWRTEIIDQCEKLGGVYIKFIQMLAVHESTKHWVKGVSTDMAYEQVTYEPINITRELGDITHKFSYISDTPFAAGSYGQVYRARLQNGDDVIVKILRPTVRKTLRQDLRILNTMAFILSFFTRSSIVNIRAITQEFSHATYTETDYIKEAASAEWLKGYYDKRGTLVIPRVYRSLSSKHILVEEYIGGISLAAAITMQREGAKIDQVVFDATGSNIWQQFEELGAESLSSTLHADFQMVDPHPGNIRLLPNNKVALIDFGMMSDAPRNKAAFVNMIGEFVKVYEDKFEPGSFAVAMLAFFDMELHDALKVVAREWSNDYMESLESFMGDYLKSQSNDGLTQHYLLDKQMARLFNQVINRGNKLGIKISRENIMLQRSMNMFLSIMRSIGESHDGKVHFMLIHSILSEVHTSAVQNGFESSPVADMSQERAYEIAVNWLTVVAENDRELYKFITNRSFA